MPTLQYLSWSSFRFRSDAGVTIVIDPFIEGDPQAGIIPAPMPHEDIAQTDLIIVTHASKDHLGSTFDLMRLGNATLGASYDVRILGAEDGLPEERMVSMVPNSPFRIEDVTIIPTFSKHVSGSKQANGSWMFGLPVSYFIQFAGGQCVFHAGDSAISLDMGLYGDLYKPTVALFGIGGQRRPGRQPVVEMSPHEAGLASKMMGVSEAIPCHFAPDDALEAEFISEVTTCSPATTPLVMRVGDTIELTSTR